MAGIFRKGETKIRPGVYFRHESNGVSRAAYVGGVVAAVFKANWGPTRQVVTLNSINDIYPNFGNDDGDNSNVKILTDIFSGGASTIKAIRVGGTSGTVSETHLKDTTESTPKDVVLLKAKYPGTLTLSVTVRDSIAYPGQRECLIYTGTREQCKITFESGEGEIDALIAAINASSDSPVTATKENDGGNGILDAVLQATFETPGKSPEITNADYSDALNVLESDASWDILCVDSSVTDVHALVATFLERATQSGLLAIAVVGEPVTQPLDTRLANAKAFNSPNIVYVANGFTRGNEEYDGWRAAAVVAGRIASLPTSDSVTHKTISGATSILGPLANGEIETALQSGAVVFSLSRSGNVWIEQGITTLVTLGQNQDAGWKKIRRTRTRYELIQRIDIATENLVGNIANDSNGRATVIAIGQGIINTMIAENKLIAGSIVEDTDNPPTADSAWFVIEVDDLDSMEKIYLAYFFRFSANGTADVSGTASGGSSVAYSEP